MATLTVRGGGRQGEKDVHHMLFYLIVMLTLRCRAA